MSARKHISFKIILFLFCTDLLETIAQFCFKKGALTAQFLKVSSLASGVDFIITLAQSHFLWLGLFFVVIIFICWSIILSKVDLSVAVPVASISYVTIPLASVIFLGEKIIFRQWSGIFLILSGIILVYFSARVREII